MIYNWEDENIDLFVGSSNGDTEKEDKGFSEMLRETSKNEEILKELVKSFGWEIHDRGQILICFDEVHNEERFNNGYFRMNVLNEKAEKMYKKLLEIKEELEKVDYKKFEYKTSYIDGKLVIYEWFYYIHDDGYSNLELKRTSKYVDEYKLEDFEKAKNVLNKELYNYLKKHQKCFWQLRNKQIRKEVSDILRQLCK